MSFFRMCDDPRLTSYFENSGELFIHRDSDMRKEIDFNWPLGYPAMGKFGSFLK